MKQIAACVIITSRLLRDINIHISTPVTSTSAIVSITRLAAGNVDGSCATSNEGIINILGKRVGIDLPSIRATRNGANLTIFASPGSRSSNGIHAFCFFINPGSNTVLADTQGIVFRADGKPAGKRCFVNGGSLNGSVEHQRKWVWKQIVCTLNSIHHARIGAQYLGFNQVIFSQFAIRAHCFNAFAGFSANRICIKLSAIYFGLQHERIHRFIIRNRGICRRVHTLVKCTDLLIDDRIESTLFIVCYDDIGNIVLTENLNKPQGHILTLSGIFGNLMSIDVDGGFTGLKRIGKTLTGNGKRIWIGLVLNLFCQNIARLHGEIFVIQIGIREEMAREIQKTSPIHHKQSSDNRSSRNNEWFFVPLFLKHRTVYHNFTLLNRGITVRCRSLRLNNMLTLISFIGALLTGSFHIRESLPNSSLTTSWTVYCCLKHYPGEITCSLGFFGGCAHSEIEIL